MQGPLQGSDAGHNGRVDIGQRGRGDARGKRRGVQLVVGVQGQRDIHRADSRRARAIAGEHVEEVGGMAHGRIGRDRVSALLHPPPGRHQPGDLRSQPHRLAIRRVRRVVGRVGVVMPERRSQGAQRIHPVGRRQHLHQAKNCLRQRPRRGQLRLEIAQLRARRQPAVPQQVAGLLKGRKSREVVNVVSAIRQNPAVAVDVADGRRGGDDVFETGFGWSGSGHGLILVGIRDRGSGIPTLPCSAPLPPPTRPRTAA